MRGGWGRSRGSGEMRCSCTASGLGTDPQSPIPNSMEPHRSTERLRK